MLKPKRSKTHPANFLSDLDFADDLALISENIKHAEELLHSVEIAANQVGLFCNEGKTEFLCTSDSARALRSLNNMSTLKD